MRKHVFQVGRFLVSGISAAGANIGTLYVLSSILGMWYVPASVIAFMAGFVVSFTLQKFWTFGNREGWVPKGQVVTYLFVVIFNLGLNTVLVYSFVEYLSLTPVIAQAFASVLIACESFFAYRYVFTPTPLLLSDSESGYEDGSGVL